MTNASSLRRLATLVCLTLAAALPTRAELRLQDASGSEVVLPAPARRIVSLAPHITELLFAAGAGDRVVGAVEYSNYPAAARWLPRIGSYNALDLEAIAALRPDLAIAWRSGNREGHLDRLRALGIPLFVSEARDLGAAPRRLTARPRTCRARRDGRGSGPRVGRLPGGAGRGGGGHLGAGRVQGAARRPQVRAGRGAR